jgi:hypothetical protein
MASGDLSGTHDSTTDLTLGPDQAAPIDAGDAWGADDVPDASVDTRGDSPVARLDVTHDCGSAPDLIDFSLAPPSGKCTFLITNRGQGHVVVDSVCATGGAISTDVTHYAEWNPDGAVELDIHCGPGVYYQMGAGSVLSISLTHEQTRSVGPGSLDVHVDWPVEQTIHADIVAP